MKKQVFYAVVSVFAAFSLFTSCKDNVSQEDVITGQQVIDLAIRIIDAADGQLPVDSAVVEIVDGSSTRTATTDVDGMVYFEDVAISNNTPVYITKTNYLTIATEIYMIPEDYRQVQVTETIKLYPLNGSNLATVTGRLTIETNVTNREREAVPAGSIVRAYNSNYASDVAFIDSTDANGNYEIKIPVDYQGNDYIELVYPEIYTNQRVAVKNETTHTVSVVNRPVYYRLSDDSPDGSIPALPSISASVEAPPSATIGSGFALETKVVPTYISAYSNALLISGGSGYNNGNDQLLELSAGSNGNIATLQVDIQNGSIVNIDGFIDNGALYTTAPALNTNALGGSGAEIEIQFEGYYIAYITNSGSGYFDFPELHCSYKYYAGGSLYEYNYEMDLDDYTNLSGGKIVNENFYYVDTIMWFSGLAGAPVFTISNTPTQQMYISFDVNDINDAGQVVDYNIDGSGYGYDKGNPPAVTLTALAGFGTDAAMEVNLTGTGVLSSIDMVNKGSGYVKNVNDFTNKGVTWDYNEDPIFSYSYYYDGFRNVYNVKPGAVIVRSAHYGTGMPDLGY
jgi:hypothetical protein